MYVGCANFWPGFIKSVKVKREIGFRLRTTNRNDGCGYLYQTECTQSFRSKGRWQLRCRLRRSLMRDILRFAVDRSLRDLREIHLNFRLIALSKSDNRQGERRISGYYAAKTARPKREPKKQKDVEDEKRNFISYLSCSVPVSSQRGCSSGFAATYREGSIRPMEHILRKSRRVPLLFAYANQQVQCRPVESRLEL